MGEKIGIRTADGECPAEVFKPRTGTGPWPAVIFYMDGMGIRPTLADMAQRIADWGYVVLLPDMFYRYGRYDPMVPAEVFASKVGSVLAPMIATTGNAKAADDTRYFLTYLDSRGDVKRGKVGTTGYCMGGGMALTAAGTFPDKVAVAASFHGGSLATDLPVSPHLLAPKIKAYVYVAVADRDEYYPPEMHDRLVAAFDAAGVAYQAELYVDALHGWTMKDFPVYVEAAAERHFDALKRLFAQHLG